MPLDTVLLVDTSGSMAGRGIRELKRACTTFMDGVEETARQTGLKVRVTCRVIERNSMAITRCVGVCVSLKYVSGSLCKRTA